MALTLHPIFLSRVCLTSLSMNTVFRFAGAYVGQTPALCCCLAFPAPHFMMFGSFQDVLTSRATQVALRRVHGITDANSSISQR